MLKCLLKTASGTLTVWSILSFQGSYRYTNFHQKLFFFWCSKIYSKHFIRDNMVWPILSFQKSYIIVHLMQVYFFVLKIYWKIISGTAQFDHYFPFQGFYQVFIKSLCFFFSVSKVSKKFESQTIWFDLYRLFRKHWSIFIESRYI